MDYRILLIEENGEASFLKYNFINTFCVFLDMCFAPWVSLTTALIEWCVAFFVLTFHKHSKLHRFVALFLIILGLYQFSEFLLCTFSSVFWAHIGFVIYTILPAAGLHLVFVSDKKDYWIWPIYILPAFFIFYSFWVPIFIQSAQCSSVFIQTSYTFFSSENLLASVIYWLYYGLYVAFATYVGFDRILRSDLKHRVIFSLLAIASILSILGSFVFIVFFPQYGLQFPSIYCQFALLFSLLAMVALLLEKKWNIEV